jgi:hypothetical protein
MANLSNINNKFLVTTGGNVLIGQTSAVGSSIFQVTGDSTLTGNVGIGYAAQSNIRTFIYDNSTNYSLAVQQDGSGVPFQVTSGGIVRLIVANTGNVGIGTDSPSKKLDIKSTNSDHIRLTHTTNTAYWDLFQNAADGSFRILKDNGSLFTFAQSGNFGIGTSSPFTNLDVNSSAVDAIIRLKASGGTADIRTWEIRAVGVAGEGLLFRQVNDANNVYTNRMILDTDGNVGIGTTSPNALLSLGNAINAKKLLLYDDNNNFKYGFGIQSNELRQFFPNSATSRMVIGTISDSDGTTFSEKMRIDSSGNLGIGTTPSDWGWYIDKAIQFKNGSYIAGRTDVTPAINIGVNSYLTATGGNAWIYYGTGTATRYNQQSGFHNFYTAISGTIGNPITWQTSMTIDSSGNVGIGTTSPDAKLHVVSTVPTCAIFDTTSASYGAMNVFKAQGVVKGNAGYNSGSMYFGGESGTNTIIQAGGQTGIYIKGDSTRNIGIGTTVPGYKLDVNGIVNFQTELYMPSATSRMYLGSGTGYCVINKGAGIAGTATRLYFGEDADTGLTMFRGTGHVTVSSAKVGIGTTGPNAKLDVYQDSENYVQRNFGPANQQGFPQKITITKWYPVTSLGTKLLIPVYNQGNLNNTTIVRMWGHSAVFNRASGYTNRSFTLDFTFGSLRLIYGLTTLNSSGNISSVTQTSQSGAGVNGEIQVNFTNNYIQSQTGASYGGVYITLEYMTGSTNKSIIASGIALN